MITLLELLEDTVAYYSEDTNRRGASDDGMCQYITDDSRECAVGRKLIDPLFIEKEGFTHDLHQIIARFGKAIFKPEYRHIPVRFWSVLQRLHDNPIYWDIHTGKGLTLYGDIFVTIIKEGIKQGIYDEDTN